MFEIPWMMLSEVFPFRYDEVAAKVDLLCQRKLTGLGKNAANEEHR
jgi:hypothetical protein